MVLHVRVTYGNPLRRNGLLWSFRRSFVFHPPIWRMRCVFFRFVLLQHGQPSRREFIISRKSSRERFTVSSSGSVRHRVWLTAGCFPPLICIFFFLPFRDGVFVRGHFARIISRMHIVWCDIFISK